MPAHPNLIALLREYWQRGAVTRPEVGRMVGKTVGQIAGICHKAGIRNWPVLKKADKEKRRQCCFPAGVPGTKSFRLCGKPLAPGSTLLCKDHLGVVWRCE